MPKQRSRKKIQKHVPVFLAVLLAVIAIPLTMIGFVLTGSTDTRSDASYNRFWGGARTQPKSADQARAQQLAAADLQQRFGISGAEVRSSFARQVQSEAGMVYQVTLTTGSMQYLYQVDQFGNVRFIGQRGLDQPAANSAQEVVPPNSRPTPPSEPINERPRTPSPISPGANPLQ